MADDFARRYDFVISRRSDSDDYRLWRVDIGNEKLLLEVPLSPKRAGLDKTHQLLSIGRYLLEWGPITLKEYAPCFPYRLLEFDPTSPDPLGGNAVQKGVWTKKKFWSYRPDFGNPHGAKEGFDSGEALMLVPLGSFILNVIPTEGRGTFRLWNFDPNPLNPLSSDPLPLPFMPQASFDTIDYGHELIPLGNYVLDWLPESSEYWLWSFDPQAKIPLGLPAIQQGKWDHIDRTHRLVAIGDLVLDWTADRRYRLWRFDPKRADPLTGPVAEGVLPEGFDAKTTLTGIQPLLPIDEARKQVPGTIDFMRDKIKHVVYLMLENRSFDHVCGWLYEKDDAGINFIGHNGAFDGASLKMFNPDTNAPGGKTYLSKYKDGKLSDKDDWDLDFLPSDPYHDKTDVMRQFFHGQPRGYAERSAPDMKGFVWNNGVPEVMMTYTPEQLPVLNGLAAEFAISDAWFCSMPGATDPNRAYAFTGSALNHLNNFQNDAQYIYWPFTPHRASLWKTLWANGFTDWKMYNSVEWMKFVHTYHLFVEGQIPSVDTAIKNDQSSFIQEIEHFKTEAREGKLRAFSYLEPAWIATGGGTTSYHPGADPAFGEIALNEIYEAIKAGPAWNETLFVITFDEHGGIFDHVSPPYAENPWPNDVNDGFRYDMMGVRVPTILISPLIRKNTVFRSPGPVAYDSTSIIATLLDWYGIPKARWWMGERVNHAPTFEGVLQCNTPRTDAPPRFPVPHDKGAPRDGKAPPRINDLHELMVPRVIAAMAAGKLGSDDIAKTIEAVMTGSTDAGEVFAKLRGLDKRFGQ
jgi:phospholipase C